MDPSTASVQKGIIYQREINSFVWMLMSVLMKMEDAPTYATTPLDHINAAVLLINFLAVTIRLVSLLLNATYALMIVKLHHLGQNVPALKA
jgi:hypothetical protein